MSIKKAIIDKLKNLGYNYKYFPAGWYDGDKLMSEKTWDEWEEIKEVPEDNWWYRERNSNTLFKDGVEFSFDVEEENKEFYIIVLYARWNSVKGEATKILEECLKLIPKDWTIYIVNNENEGYWNHIKEKHNEYKWEDIDEALEKDNMDFNTVIDNLNKIQW